MKSRIVLCLLAIVALTSYAGIPTIHPTKFVPAKVDASIDTIYIAGGTLAGFENAGNMETIINGDTTAGGARTNPNRVYALFQGQYYYQLAGINVNDPTGTVTICGVPSSSGTTKPIIIIVPTPPATQVGVDAGAVDKSYGSVKFDGIHYQAQQTTGVLTSELWRCGTTTGKKQTLTINNCLFEFSGIDLFDCTNETGNIGGWPYGASFFITNSYFRNLFEPSQWWSSRVFQCKHPIDTLWIENVTVTTGGLTFLQQNNLADFVYINHNTFINQKKYWLLSPYRHYQFITSNIFTNQNWVGEDTNVTNSGQDPDKAFMSTIDIDSCNSSQVRRHGLTVQPRYLINDTTINDQMLGFGHMRVYISDNIDYWDPLLINGYYNSSKYVLSSITALPSYLNWSGWGTGPWPIHNVPGQWMNTRTAALFAAWAPPNGYFVEKRTSNANPGMTTPDIANAALVDSMAWWNQNQWGDSRFTGGAALTKTAYIYGDYDPTTFPGVVNGHPTDTMTVGAAGITKFTDLTENFGQTTNLSGIDGLPIGALIWNDAQLAAFNSATDNALVMSKYISEGGAPVPQSVRVNPNGPNTWSLSQNYPNPFNPTTRIDFSLAKQANVDLKVFNILGQEVATIVHETLAAGQHTINFDASKLASGVYIYRLNAGDYTSSKKMVLLK